MFWRRGCLFGIVALLALCVLGSALGYFVALPRLRDNLRDEVADGIGTEVAGQIAPAGNAEPGRHVITARDLQDSLTGRISGQGLEDLVVRIAPTGVEFGFSTRGQDATYAGNPVVAGGRLAMTDMTVSNDSLGFFLRPDDVGAAIEAGVNGYLAANGLTLDGVELGEGEMTLVTAPAR
ncbi:MAG: hypothetical protein AVDCRST_MAG49-2642 [uncultured Thermomicrobiales bacterium]|uniref:DUF2993 domain-containing protein n=1 Tax=uncultured Thermomicrobiales bacterium TaxID=1645740 RepID=A0A6J4UXR5_9BACT|nr:MAG: hypothetical protein AVDCRST_MAG49-2642 [uncultured Thermomicrobiales bacterium]